MANSSIPVRALRKDILVDIYDDGGQAIMLGGKTFFTLSDADFGTNTRHRDNTTRHPGIRPRWAVVLATTDYAEEMGINVGDKVLLDTMKWSRGATYNRHRQKLWRIPADEVLMIDADGLTDAEKEYIRARDEKLGVPQE